MNRPALLAIAVLLSLYAVSARALADELPIPEPVELPNTISIQPPEGWSLLPGLSRTVARSASDTDFFGDNERFESGALAYGRVDRGALYVTWLDSLRTQPVAENTLRIAFDEIHQAPFLASPEPGSTQEVSYRESIASGVAEMRFEWAHLSNGTVNVVRALGWKDGDARVHLAIAECVLQSESIAESRPSCSATLDALSLTKESRYDPLAPLPESSATTARAPEDYTVPELETSEMLPVDSLGVAPAQMGEVLYQGPPKSKEGNDNRFIIAVGVLLLLVAFYLTTRPGPKSESEEELQDDDNDDRGHDGAQDDDIVDEGDSEDENRT